MLTRAPDAATLPPGAVVGAAAGTSPARGTGSCSPSDTGRARLMPDTSASALSPPAAATASTTRDPAANETSPGFFTAPSTCTSNSAPPTAPAEALGAEPDGAVEPAEPDAASSATVPCCPIAVTITV